MIGIGGYLTKVIYILFGITSFLFYQNVAAKQIGIQRSLWPMDPRSYYLYKPTINQHSHMMRKFYWYKKRAPIYVGAIRGPHMVANSHMPIRYRRMPTYENSVYADLQRTYLRTTEATTTPVLRSIISHATVKTTATPSTTSVIPDTLGLQSTTQELNYGKDSLCNIKHYYNTAAALPCSQKTPTSFIPSIVSSEYSIDSTEKPLATTELPYSRYITHTYFTLDDVILPHNSYSADKAYANLTKKKKSGEKFYPRPSYNSPITMPSSIEIENIFSTTQPAKLPSTIAPPPPPYEEYTTAKIFPTLLPVFYPSESTTVSYFQPLVLDSTINPNSIYTSTSTPPSSSYLNKLNYNLIDTTLSGITNVDLDDIKPTKDAIQSSTNHTDLISLKKSRFIKRLKLKPKEKLLNTRIHQRGLHKSRYNNTDNTSQNNTVINSEPIKANSTKSEKKTRSIPFVKKYANSTESKIIRFNRNRTNGLYIRRRPADYKGTRKENLSLNITKLDSTTPNTTAVELKTTTVTPKILVAKDKPKSIHNSRTYRNRTESIVNPTATSGVVESAIMTISSAEKTVKRTLARNTNKYRKARHGDTLNTGNIGISSSTDIPPLPIEVYFRKVNQT